MTTDKQGSNKLEGEGSYEGTRKYNAGVEKHLSEKDAKKLGEKAKRALEGDEGKTLEQADRDARKGP